jgi:hypothetical protein
MTNPLKLRLVQRFGACELKITFDRPAWSTGRTITPQDHIAAQHQAQAGYYASGYADLSLINPTTSAVFDYEHIVV